MAVALVTGAGSGIGTCVAELLARRGDQVVCGDLDGLRAAEVADRIGNEIAADADVTDPAECDSMVEAAVNRFGGLDTAGTCAGIEKGGDSIDFDLATFRRIVDVNLTGSFLTAQRAAQAMVDQGNGGAIVLIGSINSKVVLPGTAAYASSKGGVLLLGQALAVDFARHGIPCEHCRPGSSRHAHECGEPGRSRQAGRTHGTHPAGSARPSPRDRRGGGLPDLGRRQLHDRRLRAG